MLKVALHRWFYLRLKSSISNLSLFGRQRKGVLFTLAFAFISSFTNAAKADDINEINLKLAYIINITKYIQLPNVHNNPNLSTLSFCVLGENQFQKKLDVLAGKEIGGKKLEVVYIGGEASYSQCHIIYTADERYEYLYPIITKATKAGQLLITDGGMPSMIAMESIDDKLKISLDLVSLKRAGIKASSQLIKVSHIRSQK